MLGEHIKMALRTFTSNKLRTVLSLLGMLIGVASVILITSLGASATADIQARIGAIGIDLISVDGGWGDGRSQRVFAPTLADTLLAEIPTLAAATPMQRDDGFAKSRYREAPFSVNAVSPDYREVFQIDMAAGRFLSPQDGESRFPGVVLGYEAARRLFPGGGAVGSPLRLILGTDNYHMTVLGVMRRRDGALGASFNDTILMDLDFYRSRIAPVDVVFTVLLRARSAEDAAAAYQAVQDYLSSRIGEPDAFFVDSPSSLSDAYREVTNTLSLVLAGIAGISLIVGGIGIMNIMLVSVTERTREIGIRKALGAPGRAILWQFLIESASLTAIGGALGGGFGFVLGRIATGLLGWTFAPDYRSFAAAVAFSALIGVFFGIYPAVRAAKLNPIEALAYE